MPCRITRSKVKLRKLWKLYFNWIDFWYSSSFGITFWPSNLRGSTFGKRFFFSYKVTRSRLAVPYGVIYFLKLGLNRVRNCDWINIEVGLIHVGYIEIGRFPACYWASRYDFTDRSVGPTLSVQVCLSVPVGTAFIAQWLSSIQRRVMCHYIEHNTVGPICLSR